MRWTLGVRCVRTLCVYVFSLSLPLSLALERNVGTPFLAQFPTSHKREGRGARGGTGAIARAGNMSNGTCMREDGAHGSWPSDQLSLQWRAWKLRVFCLSGEEDEPVGWR
jgi:hypothetical protein